MKAEHIDDQSWQSRSRSFGLAARRYDHTRPSYPTDAVRWALGNRARTVVDLGAGTGILTRKLAELGHEVIAVEPDPSMRAQVPSSVPRVVVMNGKAESLPLGDASVDAVLAGQAYHWFDLGPAHAELARVIRDGGSFVALWNLRDESVAWSAQLSEILRDEDRGVDRNTPAAIMLHGALAAVLDPQAPKSGWLADPNFGSAFGPISIRGFPHAVMHTPDTLLDLIRSRSYFLTATQKRRSELEDQITHLLSTHAQLAGRDSFELPYVTLVYRAYRNRR